MTIPAVKPDFSLCKPRFFKFLIRLIHELKKMLVKGAGAGLNNLGACFVINNPKVW